MPSVCCCSLRPLVFFVRADVLRALLVSVHCSFPGPPPSPAPYSGTVRRIVILGSSGSIGTQALDVIRHNRDLFQVVGLAVGARRKVLAAQAREFGVEDTAGGIDETEALVRSLDADVVLNAITGSVGLRPTLAVLERGMILALANKESLIVGGDLVTRLARPGQIVPVDSEHSALAQALRGGHPTEVRRLVPTASGGPFRGCSREFLRSVTPAQALIHPTWDMGPVVTINSATLVNKGLEVIEARLLISLGLHWPHRVSGVGTPLDWSRAAQWNFVPLDEDAFPAVALAKQVG